METQFGAENIKWNLNDLYVSVDAPEIEQDLAHAKQRAELFADTYRGRVAQLSADELLTALQEYESINEIIAKAGTYATLIWTTDTLNSNYGRLVTWTQQSSTEINQLLIFFNLEWMEASEATAAIADDPLLENYCHYLKITRLNAPYALAEGEEHVASELSLSGVQGWQRYYGEVVSSTRFELDGKSLTQSEILQNLYLPDRDLRLRSANAFTEGLKDIAHATTYVFNMVLMNKQSMDKLRGYPSWLSSRNLSNQTDDAVVDLLIESVQTRYDIVARYYTLIRRLLGYETLYEYDRYAPILQDQKQIPWNEAREIVLDSFAAFDSGMADIARLFFEHHWIDAALAPNKRGGAYSSRVVPSVHPYIFMNYTGTLNSVMTLAHELGHGIHQYLSRQCGFLQQGTPLTTAEMASTFGEMLVFDSLMKQLENPRDRLALRLEKIADTFATVFRQISLNRFEDGIHKAFRSEGQLTTERISELWMESQHPMFGDSVVLRDQYGLWWSYIQHFVSVPGYVYAYSFGELLVWALYAIYQQNSDGFAQLYLQALSKGGSVWPEELVIPLGIDLKAADFWQNGLNLVEAMVVQAEQEAEAMNYELI